MLLVILVPLINKPGITEPIDFVGGAEIAIFLSLTGYEEYNKKDLQQIFRIHYMYGIHSPRQSW